MTRIGVLALQGDFAAHAACLRQVGVDPVEVRTPEELDGCRGLILPGGESTTLLRLMEPVGMTSAIVEFHEAGGALFGTCAGAILLAQQVIPHQACLGRIDIEVERNAYGRQRESFEASTNTEPRFAAELGPEVPMLFIRAPRIRSWGPEVETVALWGGEPVLVQQGRVLVGTGHPELTGSLVVHHLFAQMTEESPATAGNPQLRTPGAAHA